MKLQIEEGKPLSHYLEVALTDVRAALATKRYQLEGSVWHRPQSTIDSSVCLMCLAGGVLARGCGFDATRSLYPGAMAEWEACVLHALDSVRAGDLFLALELLGVDPTPYQEEVLDQIGYDIKRGYKQGLDVASLETYDAAVVALRKIGL